MSDHITYKRSEETKMTGRPRWIGVSISIGVGLFILALIVSAIVVPQLRLLHSFQALIYIAVIILTRRNSPWGFGAAVFIATAWNCLNLFITHLFSAGAGQFWSFISTGNLTRPDTMMVFIGVIGHFVIITACLAGFFNLQPGRKQWVQFFAGGLLVLAYFALIVVTTAPH
jgi:hypothetical protein